MSHRENLVCRTAAVLVVVDVQERLAAVMQHRARVVDAVGRLLRVAALLGIPIVITRQNPAGLGGVVPEVADVLASPELASADVRNVDKLAFCSSNEPAFNQELASLARRQVVLCGMETHICVTQTALGCAGEGFEVFVAADACCSRRRRGRARRARSHARRRGGGAHLSSGDVRGRPRGRVGRVPPAAPDREERGAARVTPALSGAGEGL